MNPEVGTLSLGNERERSKSQALVYGFLLSIYSSFWTYFPFLLFPIIYRYMRVRVAKPLLQAQIYEFSSLKLRKGSTCPAHHLRASHIILNSFSTVPPNLHCPRCLEEKQIPMENFDKTFWVTRRNIRFKFLDTVKQQFFSGTKLEKSFKIFQQTLISLRLGLQIHDKYLKLKNEISNASKKFRKVLLVDYMKGKIPERIVPVFRPSELWEEGHQTFELIDPRAKAIDYLFRQASRRVLTFSQNSVLQKIDEVAYDSYYEPIDCPNELEMSQDMPLNSSDFIEDINGPAGANNDDLANKNESLKKLMDDFWPKLRSKIAKKKQRNLKNRKKMQIMAKSANLVNFRKMQGTPLRLRGESGIISRQDLAFLKWQSPYFADLTVVQTIAQQESLLELTERLRRPDRNMILAIKAGTHRFALVFPANRDTIPHSQLPYLISFDSRQVFPGRSPQNNSLKFSFAIGGPLTSSGCIRQN